MNILVMQRAIFAFKSVACGDGSIQKTNFATISFSFFPLSFLFGLPHFPHIIFCHTLLSYKQSHPHNASYFIKYT